MPEIVPWESIRDGFKDGLLLGNGASARVHQGFAYASLHQTAVQLGHVGPEVAAVFEKFGTSDFELVLRRLWHAQLVNQALGIAPGKVEQAYSQVRAALINTVRATHVSHAAAKPHLEHIYGFMQHFRTVMSLNYDLIVYWACMLGNQALGPWFKDAFNKGVFREDWEEIRKPYGEAKGCTLYFYPHGNLVLARTAEQGERKIAGGAFEDLLEAVLAKWEEGAAVPVFVCEGTSAHKKTAIQASSYLQRVFSEVLPKAHESLVIYGWSMGDQDLHVLEQLNRSAVGKIAVSVRNGNKAFIQQVQNALGTVGSKAKVFFFDADSPGCWNNAT